MQQANTIMWFRQDLRLRDNPALIEACKHGAIIPLFIVDTSNTGEHQLGSVSQWWLHQSLIALNTLLDNKLHIQSGDPLAILEKLIDVTGAKHVCWNRGYEPWQIDRDTQIKTMLSKAGIACQSFNGSILWEPWTIKNQSGSAYKVFTPYYRKGCLNAPAPRLPQPAPAQIDCVYDNTLDIGVEQLSLMPSIAWYQGIEARFTPGEVGASQALQTFLSGPVTQYKTARDVPSMGGTSYLSAHFHFGEISVNQVWYAAIDQYDGDTSDVHLDNFLSELGWREFSHYLLFHFPSLPLDNFNKKFDVYQWRSENDDLRAWQQGKTGIPIVDAGMRELWQTGYMHNRVRMIVGSFLVKNLQTHWHHGERWFWDCLVDADLAANSASWQWIAGCGADAAPFFRIFNPVTQGEKFDKDGEYVKTYCPELSKLPAKYIHQPWAAPDNILQYAGVKLGHNYPAPLVDLKTSRLQALSAYEAVKQVGKLDG